MILGLDTGCCAFAGTPTKTIKTVKAQRAAFLQPVRNFMFFPSFLLAKSPHFGSTNSKTYLGSETNRLNVFQSVYFADGVHFEGWCLRGGLH